MSVAVLLCGRYFARRLFILNCLVPKVFISGTGRKSGDSEIILADYRLYNEAYRKQKIRDNLWRKFSGLLGGVTDELEVFISNARKRSSL